MTSSSKPTAQACYSTTSTKHSRPSTSIESSSTQKVRVWRPSQKITQVHGFCPRNRSKSRKGPSNRQDARANQHQRCAAAHRKTDSTEPFHQQAGRKDLTILPATQERRKIRVDLGSPQRIHRPQDNALDSTNLGGAQRAGETLPLHSSAQ